MTEPIDPTYGGRSRGPESKGGGPDEESRTVDTPLLAGGDTRLPAAAMQDERKLAAVNLRALTQLQRAAAQMTGRMRRLKLFGPNAELGPEERDQVGVQLLFELRKAIGKLDEIDTTGDDVTAAVKIQAVQAHLSGLKNLADTHTRLLSEISKITDVSQRALASMARLEIERKRVQDDPENLSDAELAGD